MMLAEILDTSYSKVQRGLTLTDRWYSKMSARDIPRKQVSKASRVCCL